ncbi:MAG: XrtA/PEP-CTERM system TPR-repeat protein PrsT [Thiohalocapsa sp.]
MNENLTAIAGRPGLLAFAILLLPLTVASDDAIPLERATALFGDGRYVAAEIVLKNLLREDPSLIDARLMLGQLYLRNQNGAAAEKELLRAKELGAQPTRWRSGLAEAYIQQGRFRLALSLLDDEVSSEVGTELALRGRALLGLGEFDQAKAAFAGALERAPGDKVAASGLVQLAVLTGDTDIAGETSAALAEQFPDDSDVMLLRAEVLRQMDDSRAAIDQFKAVLAQEPENLRALLGRATIYVRLLEFEKARADLDSADRLQQDIVIVGYLRGVIAFMERDWDQAELQLQRVNSAQPNHLQSRLLLGIVSYARNQLQMADEYLSAIVTAMPGNVQAVKVLAATRLKLREPEAAIELLEPLETGDDPQIMALLGSAYMLAGDPERGQSWLHRAVEMAPDVAALRTQFALTLIAGGNTVDAIEELETAVELGQDVLQADVLLVLAQLKEERYDEAIGASIALENRRPGNPVAPNLTGLAFLAEGKLDEARARFERALEVDPDFSTALINMARVDIAGDDAAAAAARYQRVLEKDPRNLAALLGMAGLAERRNDDAALLKWLNKAQDTNSAAIQPGLLLVGFHINRRDYLRALTVATNLAARFPDDLDVLRVLGRTQTLAGQETSAILTFDQILQKRPDDARIHYLRGGAQRKAKDYAASADSFRRAMELEPDFFDARVALASVLLAARDHSGVLSVARALQRDYPDRDTGFHIEGTAQLAAHTPESAVAPLRKAFALQPNPEAVRQLAQAYVESGSQTEAIAILEQWASDEPKDLGSQARLAMLLHGQGMEDRALALYEHLNGAGDANPVILNNLAWILYERADPRALEIAEKAYELNPNRPEVADTLGWILYNRGKPDRGLRILQEAHLAYPAHTEVAYHTAVALDGMGRGKEAVKILRRLLREHPNADQAPAAQALLDELTVKETS